MKRHRCWLLVVLSLTPLVTQMRAAVSAPQIGYAYPAGGRQGSSVRVTVGGQSLRNVDEVRFSGTGVQGAVIEYARALDNEELRKTAAFMRDLVRLRWSAAAMAAARQADDGEPPLPDHPWLRDLDDKSADELRRLWVRLFDPKRQPNAQIAEQVVIEVSIDAQAPPGDRELRLVGPDGASNPLVFQVGRLPEAREEELALAGSGQPAVVEPPVVLNGQIMPGEVDRFRLQLKRGQRLVARVAARRLIPYLADAVPGWFQATLRLRDGGGGEVAYNDDFRFDPDPALLYEVPADGVYYLEVSDAIYRGREDFVYRIAVGELPFVTSVFPLGGREGAPTTVVLGGWNLPAATLALDTTPGRGEIREAVVGAEQGLANRIAYAVSELPEVTEAEPNDGSSRPQVVSLPVVVNGLIQQAGDRDLFAFDGRAGEELVAEVYARRLGSPLDCLLRLTGPDGQTVAINDDYKDPAMGLVTHHADSYLRVQLPQDGVYQICVSDAQRQGGEAWAYRLYLRPPRPDFALRLAPSAVNVPSGRSATAKVHIVRKDGFAGEVELALADAPAGFTLSGGRIAEGQDAADVTITAPRGASRQVAPLRVEGRAAVGGATVTRPVVPAEDMMQAFAWRFLVPQSELLVVVTGARPVPVVWRPLARGMRVAGPTPVRIPLGGTAQVRVEALAGGPEGGLEQVRFRLGNHARGVTLREVAPAPGGVALTLKADRNMALVGDAGNLIIEASAGPTGPSLGVLPAVPFEIVRPGGA